MQYMPYMSHGTDVVDVTHLAIHGKVTYFNLILEYSTGVGDFDCCDVIVTICLLSGTKKNGVSFIRVESQTV